MAGLIGTSVTVTISLEEQMSTFQALAKALYRVDAFECLKGTRRKCDCFDCVPLTMEEACIRHLAGEYQDFRFIS